MLILRRDVNWAAPIGYVLGVIAMAMLIAQAYARIERRRIDWTGVTSIAITPTADLNEAGYRVTGGPQ